VAGSLDVSNKSSKAVSPRTKKIRKLIDKGYTAAAIGKKLYPNDERKAKLASRQAYRILATDAEIQKALAEEGKGVLIEATPATARAVVKRSLRGRTDAAKLVFEASGFHNPRVQHEHSGDIKVTLAIPRPESKEIGPGKEEDGQPVVDAEVVEEE
jgi:hypothetical protein